MITKAEHCRLEQRVATIEQRFSQLLEALSQEEDLTQLKEQNLKGLEGKRLETSTKDPRDVPIFKITK